jgi:hypothetical protein
MQSYDDICKKQMKRITDAFGGDLGDEMREQQLEGFRLGQAILEHYFVWAPAYDRDWTPLYSEVEFEVPINVQAWLFDGNALPPGFHVDKNGDLLRVVDGELYPVVYQGRLDVVMKHRDGGIWIWDHKTAKSFQSNMAWLDMDQQVGSYVWALEQKMNIRCEGVILNQLKKWIPDPPDVLKNGHLSKNKNQKTTEMLYRQAIIENDEDPAYYVDFLEYLRENKKAFRRLMSRRPPRQLKALEFNIIMEAFEMAGNPYIYPDPSQFHCGGCPQFNPCQERQDGGDFDWLLQNSGLYSQESYFDDETAEVEVNNESSQEVSIITG